MDTFLPSRKPSKEKRTRFTGLCWRSKNELTSGIRIWTSSNGRASAGKQKKNISTTALCEYMMKT